MHCRPVCLLIAGVLLAVALVGAAAAAPGPVTAHYRFAAPTMQAQAGGERVAVPGVPRWGPPGAPLLPYRTCSILLPPSADVAAVAVTGSAWADVPGTHVVEHGGQYARIGEGDGAIGSPRDEALYASTDWYPAQPWTEWSVQHWRGHALLVLNLAPVRYLPASGWLQWQEEMTVTVTLRPAVGTLGGVTRVSTTRADLEYLRQHADNPEAVDGLTALPAAAAVPSPLLDPDTPYDYVIITNAAFAALTGDNSLQDLAAQKTARGTAATIVTTEWIYANYSGTRPDGASDDQTRIRNFIIDAYNTWGTHYVLLAGDADGADVGGESGDNIVPYRGFAVNAGFADGTDDDIPSDLYYACLDGTFDGDADGKYGEPNDGPGGGDVDLLAEVHVGRAAVDQESEVRNFVAKTLACGSSTPPRDVLMVGEYVGFGGVGDLGGNYKDEIKSGSSNYGFTTMGFLNAPIHDSYDVSTLYDPDDVPAHQWPTSALTSRINAGLNVVNHLGHANTVYVMKLEPADADALTNTDYFIGYSQGCYAGAFDNRDYTPGWYYLSDCIAEHLTLAAGGAAALIANSRYGWAYTNSTDGPSQRLDREFWDAVLAEDIVQIGAANDDSKWDNLSFIRADLIGRWCAYEANLLGDPQLRIKLGLSSAGLTLLDRSVYGVNDLAAFSVRDLDLDTDPDAAETVSVTVTSGTEPGGETVVCTETGVDNGIFRGSIALAPGAAAADGVLQVADGDTITVTYIDADDGSGGTDVPRTATATIDGAAPAFAGLASAAGGDGFINLSWATATDPAGPVSYHIYRAGAPGGEDFGAPLATTAGTSYHDSAVTPAASYYYVVRAEDALGNEDANVVERSAISFLHVAAAFTASVTSGPGPLAVTFTDHSTGTVVSRSWDFGDGGTSAEQNPSHSYTSAGSFTVRLTVSNPLSSDTEIKAGYIMVTAIAPVADFSASTTAGSAPLEVSFTDLSANGPTAWAWDFGDHSSSSEQSPTHEYSALGSFDVSLTATNAAGSDTETKPGLIRVVAPVAADFSASNAAGIVPLAVSFSDLSTGDPTAWAWDFGDGATSTAQDPTHTYGNPGYYTVTLWASNDVVEDTEMRPGCVAAGFTDTPADHWAFHPILACATADVVQGYYGNKYRPEEEVTRGQMAVYISRALAGGDQHVPDPTVSSPTFPDVTAEHWAYRYVEYVKAQGIVQGYPDGGYHPEEAVNRGQMAVYIARSVATPTGDAGVPEASASDPAFPDVTATNDWGWCYRYVQYIATLDPVVVQGYPNGTYRPEVAVTRDQMAVYVQRAFALPVYGP